MPRADRPWSLAYAARCVPWALAGVLALGLPQAHAFLTDEEARRAIVDLRNRLSSMEADLRARIGSVEEAGKQRQAESAAAGAVSASQSSAKVDALAQQMRAQLDVMLSTFQRSIFDLNTQIDVLRTEINSLRGTNEQLTRDLTELQRVQRDVAQAFDDRFRQVEPVKVEMDGREFMALPEERRQFEDAMRVLRSGEFDRALRALVTFQRRHPGSGYIDTARYWTANAYYVQRNHERAIPAFRLFIEEAPQHPRAPEALLGLANSLAETRDSDGARKTLEQLLRAYPRSEAAAEGKGRLEALR
jgi:tol-pal system protein YbgF